VLDKNKGRLVALLTAALVAAGCGSSDSSSSDTGSSSQSAAQPGKGKPAVTIGTKDFTEEFVLGQLYTQALKAKGYTVNLKSNIGATEIVDKALTSGKIDAYPEYTGETVATVAGNNTATGSAAKTTALAKAFYAKRGQFTSNPTPFQDVDSVAVLKAYGAKNGLTSLPDLKKLKTFTIGARPEFKDRQVGFKGMQQVYGLNNGVFKQLASGLQYPALDKGDIDTANVFTTDAQLATKKYTLLKDPKGVFGFQNVLFVINAPKYKALGGPAFMSIINKVNALLTPAAIVRMNAAVATEKKDPAEVAGAFLSANGLK
jgi:osmoprotectant transport system substrate-binding protein